MGLILDVPPAIYQAVISHLLRALPADEEAAFIFVRSDVDDADVLRFVEWAPVDRSGFALQSSGYLELADEMRPRLIKRAHDLGACLVELHSHPYPWPAEFSATDLRGLEEFVPHVRWRLKGKPYVAIVVAPSGFDALAWTDSTATAKVITGLRVGGRVLTPTGRTHHRLELGGQ